MVHNDEFQAQLKNLVKNALAEDIGPGDYSTLACIDKAEKGRAVLKIKDDGILAGVAVAEFILKYFDREAIVVRHKSDGDEMKAGETAFEIEAKVHTILTCERLLLNCMQRMSGIATLTRAYTARLDGWHTKLLDTRKTTPNFRLLEKEAVRIGGGCNHRFGLYDMIMLKDNHIDYCGGIAQAIAKAYQFVKTNGLNIPIEVEARSIKDVREIIKTGKIDKIMLDNFSPEKISESLAIIQKKYETEASGGITLDNLESYAATGVDYISSGAVIHQAKSLDLSLKAEISA